MNDLPGFPELDHPNIEVAVRTLLTGGFILENAHRSIGYMLLYMYRIDEFGVKNKYCFLLSEGQLLKPQVDAAKIAANQNQAQLVLISDVDFDYPVVSWTRFINLLGGPVFSTNALETDFPAHLIELGHNKLPDGFIGNASDLFEDYVRVGLEFILAGRVLRYGQDRRFEIRPDGIAIPHLGFSALYDAKAYSNGYQIDQDTIRQFGSYIRDFNRRYRDYVHLNAFIVVSGTFPQGKVALESRSRDFLAEFGVPLSCLSAGSLGEIVSLLRQHPIIRRSIDWRRVFTDAVVQPDRVESEIQAIKRDGIIK